jgi:tetratricopeptide (TPR) repeat protein
MINSASVFRLQWLPSLPVLLLLITAFSCSTFAHTGVHEELQALTLLIQQDPVNPHWYLHRGDLYRIHQDRDLALADFRKARQLDTRDAAAELGLGRTWLEQGSPQQALAHLNRALTLQPANVRALVTRAMTYRALGEPLAAAADYDRAIGQFSEPDTPLPEYYLERARAFTAAGDAHIGKALQGLDEGMQVLGDLQTLALYAVELEKGRGHYDAALTRLDPLLEGASRKELLLLERGDILLAANRQQEARQDFLAAQAAIAALPPRYRQTRLVQQLESELTARLRLSGQRKVNGQ